MSKDTLDITGKKKREENFKELKKDEQKSRRHILQN